MRPNEAVAQRPQGFSGSCDNKKQGQGQEVATSKVTCVCEDICLRLEIVNLPNDVTGDKM